MCGLGLDYAAGFGTLLGLTRSDRLIPWTSDKDYMIITSTANAMVDLWDANATGMAYMWSGIPRMCITSDFAEGKVQRWETTPNSSELIWSGSPYIDLYPNTSTPGQFA